jgi:uncharacterized cupredoxin-like copper-binding protein
MRLAKIAAIAAVLGIAGCGSGGTKTVTPSSTAGGSRGATVSVTESEFKLSPTNLTVKKSGPVTFTVANAGKIPHSLSVEGQGTEKRIPGTIAPGASQTLKITLKPGKYEWYCPVDGHKGMGMKGTITVAGKGSSSTKRSSGATTSGSY